MLDFADELTCVIGASGAGKTTMLELIRCAQDALPSATADPAARRRVESLVQENLRGGRVELTVETRDGMTYIISRAWSEDPIILTDDGRATQITLRSGALFQADIYSQNEVEAIADRSASQLNLLDAFEREAIAAINVQLDQLLHDLAANASAMLPLQGKINLLSEAAYQALLTEALKNARVKPHLVAPKVVQAF